jgi:hypothetical protein
MSGDVPLMRALRMVEDLIRERMAGLTLGFPECVSARRRAAQKETQP